MREILICFAFLIGWCGTSMGRELRTTPEICAKGQAYWCQNITTAAGCGAVKHCIQSVWEQERPIEVDRSEICQTCLDMVKQARDQLLSNETQEDIKQVLDGTCKLLPIKIVREECIKLMDQFGPELVDTLASEMEPQVVCSVAGLCDNARVHRLEAEHNRQRQSGKLDCNSCAVGVVGIRSKVEGFSRQDFYDIISKMCSKLGSYSDACFDITMREYKNALDWLNKHWAPSPVCNMARYCTGASRHPVPIATDGVSVSVVKAGSEVEGDLPCELCIQLVHFLRDTLVSNTTELEFKQVLTGICGQMKTYKDECLSMVDQYYDIIYQFLTTELDGVVICKDIKICPPSITEPHQLATPLLRVDTIVEEKPVPLPETRYNPLTYMPAWLIDNGANDQTLCSMCEFFLHFVQQEMTLPSSEEKLKEFVDKGCSRLPSSVSEQCKSFVDTYMDQFVALLAQEIDPSQVCPSLGVCPRGLVAVPYQDKPDCPLCLLAFQEIHYKISKTNRTATNINDIVDDLCVRDEFPNSLSLECVAFITRNRRAIVDMVLTEFTPQESCAYIDLCIPSELEVKPIDIPVGDIYTNEIRDNPNEDNSNACVLCEFIMTKIDIMLKDKKTEEEIKDAVFHVCDVMPKSITPKCRNFISQYAELVIELLAQEMEPKEVCTALNLCPQAKVKIQESMKKCLLCEVLMDALKTVLTDTEVDYHFNNMINDACSKLPDMWIRDCHIFVEQVAPQIEMALKTLPVGPLICSRINVCHDGSGTRIPLNKDLCVKGSPYWCISSSHAAMCNAIDYCQKEVWKGLKPKKGHNKGQVVIAY